MAWRPLVSVVVPMYNHAQFVGAALDSVIFQDYRPLEIIAVDDGSADDTAKSARERLASQRVPHILVERKNRGAAATLNEGMSIARGDYIAILNSDDLYLPSRLARCVDAAQRLQKEFIFTGVEFVDEANAQLKDDEYVLSLREAEKTMRYSPTLGFAFLQNQLAISTGNFFFSRRLMQSVGPFQSYRYVHDWDFILRALFFVEPYFIEDRLYAYRLHGRNSFKALASVAGYETGEVMRNALWALTSRIPRNPIAPCPWYWPQVFEEHIRSIRYSQYLPPRFRGAL